MYKHLNLYKDKLPKRKRFKVDDDINVEGTYNPSLDTKGYDVEEAPIRTANKAIQVDFPMIEGVEWLYDSKVKDYKNLLKERRDKMTQTFRCMLRQNETPYSSLPSSSSSSSSSRKSSNIIHRSRSSSEVEENPTQRTSGIGEDLRRVREFFHLEEGKKDKVMTRQVVFIVRKKQWKRKE